MDKFSQSAKKGLDFLKSRAQETVEVQKLSQSVKQLEERRQNCLLDLGHRVITAFETEDLTDDTFRDRVEEVRSLTSQIDKAKSEHSQTKKHLKQSVEDIFPGRSPDPVPGPDYETL